ncbi:hypothetical protein HMPREF0973_01636 [Prevotella veroralis F0319]|uniref:Uncharacterized protein n=1 Tax=Prevotella veroralis F0319 TaxID=649761 RepID=C9MPU5_9BACT|nr:hypothetical protein HMPREF0973_01636 [Prevotella veroralis F0319]
MATHSIGTFFPQQQSNENRSSFGNARRMNSIFIWKPISFEHTFF